MKLTQSRVVPLVIFIAIIVAVTATLTLRGQFALGHEDPAACNFTNVSLSVEVTDGTGAKVAEVSHGEEVSYNFILSLPDLPPDQTACNYEGGELLITLPNGETVDIVGFDEDSQIPLIALGSAFEAPSVSYTVDQNDAVNSVLSVQVLYSGGQSHSVAGDGEHPVLTAAVPSQMLLKPPSVAIAIEPDTQNVYEGGDANFTISIENNGGFELSSIMVTDSLDTDCERNFESMTLAVDETTSFDCSMSPTEDADNVATVTAAVVGGVPPELASVEATAEGSLTIEETTISIEMEPPLQRRRTGTDSEFTISVSNPNSTSLREVDVRVSGASECDRFVGDMALGATMTYECSSTHEIGRADILANVKGQVVGVGKTLTDSAEVEVIVFDVGLVVTKTTDEPEIIARDTAKFTVTVTNQGNTELTNVTVVDDSSPLCSMDLETLEPEQEVTYDCESGPLDADLVDSIITVTGTAPDGAAVAATATVSVTVLHPNTAVALTKVDTTVLRLVVQVLTITESNTGDTSLRDVKVVVEPTNQELGVDSKEFIGGDDRDDGVLDPGETWEWRVVIVSVVAGDNVNVVLASDAETVDTVDVTVTGHGYDPLGNDTTFSEGYETEQVEVQIPIMN